MKKALKWLSLSLALIAPVSATHALPLAGGTEALTRHEIGRFRGCTATLITPRHALTAARCLANYTDTTVKPTDALILTDASSTSYAYGIQRIHSFASQRWEFTSSSDNTRTMDLALLRLTVPVPSSVATPAALSGVPPLPGSSVALYGYGCGDRETFMGGLGQQYFNFSFGSPTTALCAGDFGGPATFSSAPSRGALWGVGSDFQGSGSIATRTDVFADASSFKYAIERLIAQWENNRLEGVALSGPTYAVDGSVSDPGQCESKCNLDTQCRSFTYTGPGGCYLKTVVGDWVPQAGSISGFAPVMMRSGMLQSGQTYSSFGVPERRPELCMLACARDPQRCKGYTYQTVAYWGTSRFDLNPPTCALKSGDFWIYLEGSPNVSGITRSREVNVDRPGFDFHQFIPTTADPMECELACAREARCKAYTYGSPSGSEPARCWLKSAVNAPVTFSGMVSGVKRGLEMNTQRSGGNYRTFDLDKPEPEHCQAVCNQESQCKAFTYAPPGVTGLKASCQLKDSVPEASSSPRYISGTRGTEFF